MSAISDRSAARALSGSRIPSLETWARSRSSSSKVVGAPRSAPSSASSSSSQISSPRPLRPKSDETRPAQLLLVLASALSVPCLGPLPKALRAASLLYPRWLRWRQGRTGAACHSTCEATKKARCLTNVGAGAGTSHMDGAPACDRAVREPYIPGVTRSLRPGGRAYVWVSGLIPGLRGRGRGEPAGICACGRRGQSITGLPTVATLVDRRSHAGGRGILSRLSALRRGAGPESSAIRHR